MRNVATVNLHFLGLNLLYSFDDDIFVAYALLTCFIMKLYALPTYNDLKIYVLLFSLQK